MGRSPLNDKEEVASVHRGQNQDSWVNVSGLKCLAKDEKNCSVKNKIFSLKQAKIPIRRLRGNR